MILVLSLRPQLQIGHEGRPQHGKAASDRWSLIMAGKTTLIYRRIQGI